MNLERAFSLIRQLQGALGGKSLRGGSGTVTFTASATSASTVIAHGLGHAPSEMQLTPQANLAMNGTADAANITVVGYHVPGTPISGSFGFYWSARG